MLENCSYRYTDKLFAGVVFVNSEFLRRLKQGTQLAGAEDKMVAINAMANYKPATQSDEAATVKLPKADQKVVLMLASHAATVNRPLLAS